MAEAAMSEREKIRILAQWLKWSPIDNTSNSAGIPYALSPPNYYEDEIGNAMVRDKLRSETSLNRHDIAALWRSADWKAAVCEAALRHIQSRVPESAGSSPATPVGGKPETTETGSDHEFGRGIIPEPDQEKPEP